MAKHKISGLILEQHCNCDKMLYLDTSEYLTFPEPCNNILQITFPNWDNYYTIPYNMNAITILKPELFNHNSFPSGIYEIIQSVSPNDIIKHSFCYLNICCELQRIIKLSSDICDEDLLETLFNLRFQFITAQDLIYAGYNQQGIELYNVSVKQLDKLEKPCDIC